MLHAERTETVTRWMLSRLSRTTRLKAGWCIAMAYLLCVLAPTLSFALPGEHSFAICLTDEDHVPGMVHVHNDAPPAHIHGDGHTHHHHSDGLLQANSVGEQPAMSMAPDGKSAPQKVPHSSDRQCCGMMSVSALPAVLIDIVTPSVPTAICEAEGLRKVTDNAPSRLYRPPIA
jgi:hypothetical protein